MADLHVGRTMDIKVTTLHLCTKLAKLKNLFSQFEPSVQCQHAFETVFVQMYITKNDKIVTWNRHRWSVKLVLVWT